MRHRSGARSAARRPMSGLWRRATLAVTAALAVATATAGVAGCSGGDDEPSGAPRPAGTTGQGEGALDLLTLPGYVEGGFNDPRVDWVKPFEDRTKCRVNVRTVKTADELADLMSGP